MTQTLTQLTAQVQSLFIDDGTRFTAATITAAVRQALKDFNAAAPQRLAETQDAVNGQYDYELTDLNVMAILDVLQEGADAAQEAHTPLPYSPYFEDGRAWIRLLTPLGSGTLIFRYSLPHTLSGLDGAVESTLNAWQDGVLVDGACYYACLARAASRIETVNLNPDVPDPWQEIAALYQRAFNAGLALAGRPPAAQLPDSACTRTWQDAFHQSP